MEYYPMVAPKRNINTIQS